VLDVVPRPSSRGRAAQKSRSDKYKPPAGRQLEFYESNLFVEADEGTDAEAGTDLDAGGAGSPGAELG
jgi:hypothetical protein